MHIFSLKLFICTYLFIMKTFLLLILINLSYLLGCSQSQSLPYAVDFDNGLPGSWSSSNFWKPTILGVQNTGGMVAKDHVAIVANSEMITPHVDLSGTSHPVLQFTLTMGRFSDGKSTFTVHADYGNGWVPIFGCSADTSFGFTNYPNLYKVKTPENIYSITDTAS